MKNIQYICLLILLTGLFSSCEDVIELELKDTDPRIVIDASLNANTETINVLITETNDFYNNDTPVGITNATVVLTAEDGTILDIPESTDGQYSLENVQIVPGDKYSLKVTIADEEYNASTIAPSFVPLLAIDSMRIEPAFGSGEPFFQTLLSWVDTPDEENYYRVRGILDEETPVGPYAFYNDNGLDGELFFRPLMARVSLGDKMEFQLINIDKETHDYFLDVAAVQSQGFGGSTPFNPKGNFDNDALGYFGIKWTSSITIQF